MKVETFDLGMGDGAIIFDSGFKGNRLVIFEDCAYNISVDYLTEEVYNKICRTCNSHNQYNLVKIE